MPDALQDTNMVLMFGGALVALLLLWWVFQRSRKGVTTVVGAGILLVGVVVAVLYDKAEHPLVANTKKHPMTIHEESTAGSRAPAGAGPPKEKTVGGVAREATIDDDRQVERQVAKPSNPRRQQAPSSEINHRSAVPTRSPSVEAREVSPSSRTRPSDPNTVKTDDDQTRGIAPAGTEKWDVVPVFYGTDRARSDQEQRIAYSANRGKRLEVGRALVTVPKSHRVPNIERPWVYKIPFFNIVILKEKEDPAKHFTLRELKSLTQDEFARLAQQRIGDARLFEGQALVFVHGFNTTFDYAVYRAAQLSYDLKFDGGSFVYSWPSRGEVSPTGYSADRESAEQAERYLEEYLKLVATRSNATSMTLIAHSMGNKLLMPVLQKLKLRKEQEFNISQIILAAPDVDRDTFASLAKEIHGLSSGITLYAAANDRALDVSRQFWGGIPRAGDVPAEGPIVVPGIDTIDVTATSTEMFSLNHSGYAEKTELLRDISSLMTDGYRSPGARLPFLIRVPTPAGAYWRFP